MKKLNGSHSLLAGVSTGLGHALAYDLSRAGSTVLITARNGEKLKKIAESAKTKYFPCDLNRESDLLLEHFSREIGEIDNLVVLIGGYVQDSILDMKGLDEMLESHVRTTLRFVEKCVKKMHPGSNIVLVSSTQTMKTSSSSGLSYSIAKTALNKATEVMASSLIPVEIRVNAVAPSSMTDEFVPDRDYSRLRKIGDLQTPPEDVASVIKWLLSPESEWVNGAVIPVDGGYRLK